MMAENKKLNMGLEEVLYEIEDIIKNSKPCCDKCEIRDKIKAKLGE